jgi:hypothetical protein
MNFEIGDSFVIIDTPYFKYNCKDKKSFIIKSFSKSGLSVYYNDTRTNKKCRCNNCVKLETIKCIGVCNIELVATRMQRERDQKLKKLGI